MDLYENQKSTGLESVAEAFETHINAGAVVTVFRAGAKGDCSGQGDLVLGKVSLESEEFVIREGNTAVSSGVYAHESAEREHRLRVPLTCHGWGSCPTRC